MGVVFMKATFKNIFTVIVCFVLLFSFASPIPAKAISQVLSQHQIFNVSDFGAKGDGLTDDSAAINSAINHASTSVDGTVSFSSKTYLIKSPIYLLSNVSLKGINKNSSIIKCGNTGLFMIYFKTNVSNCEISNLTIDGANYNDAYGILIAYNGNNNITIDNDIIHNFKGNCVGMRVIGNSKNITVSNVTVNNIGDNTISNTGYYGIGIYIGMGVSNVTVQNSELFNTWGSSAILMNPPDTNININNNNIHDTFQRAIEAYYIKPGICNINVHITANTINNAGILNNTGSNVGSNGIFLANDFNSGNKTNFFVSGNYIENTGENGIECWIGGLISGNTIRHTGVFQGIGKGSTEGIYVSKYSSVTNNTIEYTSSEGIIVNAAGSPYLDKGGITISNNTIRNVGLIQHPYGIHIRAAGSGYSISNVDISKNNINDNQTRHTTAYGISVVVDAGGRLSNITVKNNLIGKVIVTPYEVSPQYKQFVLI